MALHAAGRMAINAMVVTGSNLKHGNLTGAKTDAAYQRWGQLPKHHIAAWQDSEYTIWSYDTPIAWLTDDVWYVPLVSYSPTTTNHQSCVRFALTMGEFEYETTVRERVSA